MLRILLPFAAAAFVLAIVPGPTTAVMMRQTLRSGRQAALATILGSQTGLLFWSGATAFGLSAVVAASQVAYDVMRVIGALVLVALGVQSLLRSRRSGSAVDPTAASPGQAPRQWSRWGAFRIGLATELGNPKAAVFALSFLPQFVPSRAPVLATTLLLGVVWVAVDTTWYVLLTSLIARSRFALTRAPLRRWLERVSGSVLIGLGVRVALQKR